MTTATQIKFPDGMPAAQAKAFVRIQRELGKHFSHGLISVIYRGSDGKMHIHAATKAASREQTMDLARRTLNEIEIKETGLIVTLPKNMRNGKAG